MRVDAGNAQLEALGKLIEFPNLVGDDIDLDEYRADEVRHRVKSADAFREEMIKAILGDADDAQGHALPWPSFNGKFDLRKHEMTVWTGYKGHGKSAFISQLLVSMMKRGQRMFIISPEFRPARVLERMLYQFTAARLVEPSDIDYFLATASRHCWLYDNQASLNPHDVIALCRYAAKELQVDHILIDSLMKCGIGPEDYAGQKNFVDRVQSICHQYPLHLHLVAHARKGTSDDSPARLHDVKGGSEIADMAENVVSVWRNKSKEKDPSANTEAPDCTVTVEAQRNAEGWIGTVPLLYDTQTMLFYQFGQSPERLDRVQF